MIHSLLTIPLTYTNYAFEVSILTGIFLMLHVLSRDLHLCHESAAGFVAISRSGKCFSIWFIEWHGYTALAILSGSVKKVIFGLDVFYGKARLFHSLAQVLIFSLEIQYHPHGSCG